MTIRFVYFDLGNVLLNFSIQRLLYQVSELTGRSEEEVRQILFSDKKYTMLERGEITPTCYFDQICLSLKEKLNPDSFIEATNNIFWVNDTILSLARHLCKINFPRGILTNTGPQHWHYILGTFHCITSLFPKHRVASFQAKCMKPYPEIYEVAYKEAQTEIPDLKPEEILLIDDLEENVKGATEFGFQSIIYTGTPELLETFRTMGLPCPE